MCIDGDMNNCIGCYAAVFSDGVGPDSCVYGEENLTGYVCAPGYTLTDDIYCFGDGTGSDDTEDDEEE